MPKYRHGFVSLSQKTKVNGQMFTKAFVEMQKKWTWRGLCPKPEEKKERKAITEIGF